MKIMYINTVCGIGSTGNIVTGLLDVVKSHNGEGRVAFGFGNANKVQPEEGWKVVSKAGYYFHNLLSRITDHEGLFSSRQTEKLIKRIKAYEPDVIHLHNLHGHYINYEKLFDYLSKANKPVFWTLHDCWAFTGHCTYFTAVNCNKWKAGCNNCSQLKAYPKCYTTGDVNKNYFRRKKAFTSIPNMTIVTPSYWLCDIVKESFLKDYPVKIIQNGIDLSVFRPANNSFRKKYHCENKFILLGVAFDWGYRKGFDVFIELANRLDEKYQIVLVGTNDDIDKLLPDNIISIHRTHDQRELAEIYTAADLFVNPTREEVLGLVNVESLACGTPVVTFRTGGSPECIDKTCGSVVDCDDIDALEREICRISNEQPYSQQACTYRAKAFDRNERFEEYYQLYEDALK